MLPFIVILRCSLLSFSSYDNTINRLIFYKDQSFEQCSTIMGTEIKQVSYRDFSG